jgi:glycosyltransferase involved in cell wall biosynthesis
MSRLVPRKRPLVAIETAAALTREFPTLELMVVGRGELLETIRSHSVALGVLDRVQLVPWVSDAEKAWLLESADVFLMPSTLEGFGLVALESQLAGTPVVAGPAAALAEVVVPGVTGLLVDGAPASFVKATRELLASGERRAALGAAAKRHAAAFTWDATASATAASYRQVLTGRAG